MNTGAINPGDVVLHYQIEDRLGAGGMGLVFKALDLRLKRHVAVKFLPPHLLLKDTYRERQLREAVAASAIEHPNIGAVHAVEETPDGGLFIVMSYYPGGTLKQRLEHNLVSRTEAIGVALQTARGLSEAHSKGIIHRDIKPSNLILTPQGVVKIVDFGLAKVLGDVDITETGTTMGTAAYMSPEQAMGSAVDHRTDIWALGVVFYEMLHGSPPFNGENTSALLYAVVHKEPPPLSGLPAPLQQILRKSLAKAPADRYANAAQFIQDVESFQAAQPNAESTQTISSSRLPSSSGRRFPLWAAAALAAILLGGAAWFGLSPHKPPQPPAGNNVATQPVRPLPSQPAQAAPAASEPAEVRPIPKAAAAAPHKKEEPPVYAGSKAGRIVWTGELDGGQDLDLTAKDAVGSVIGVLPGVPVSVTVIPTSVQIVTPPSAANRWRRLVIRNDGKKRVFIVINWAVIPP